MHIHGDGDCRIARWIRHWFSTPRTGEPNSSWQRFPAPLTRAGLEAFAPSTPPGAALVMPLMALLQTHGPIYTGSRPVAEPPIHAAPALATVAHPGAAPAEPPIAAPTAPFCSFENKPFFRDVSRDGSSAPLPGILPVRPPFHVSAAATVGPWTVSFKFLKLRACSIAVDQERCDRHVPNKRSKEGRRGGTLSCTGSTTNVHRFWCCLHDQSLVCVRERQRPHSTRFVCIKRGFCISSGADKRHCRLMYVSVLHPRTRPP